MTRHRNALLFAVQGFLRTIRHRKVPNDYGVWLLGIASLQRYSCCVEQKEGEVFAEFGVLNFWTYVVGAFYRAGAGPNTLFVLKTGIGHGVKRVSRRHRRVYRRCRTDVPGGRALPR